MPIVFMCSCGQQLQTADANAGKLVKCPLCGKLVYAPSVHAAVHAPAAEHQPEEIDIPDETSLVPLEGDKTLDVRGLGSPLSSGDSVQQGQDATGTLQHAFSTHLLPPLSDHQRQDATATDQHTPSPPGNGDLHGVSATTSLLEEIPPESLESLPLQGDSRPPDDPADHTTASALPPPTQPPARQEVVTSAISAAPMNLELTPSAPPESSPVPLVFILTEAHVISPESAPPGEVLEVTEEHIIADIPKQPAVDSEVHVLEVAPDQEGAQPPPQLPTGITEISPGIDADSMPILEDEEKPGQGAAADAWYDSRGIDVVAKPRRAGLRLDKEHLELREEGDNLRTTDFGLNLIFWGILLLMVTFGDGLFSMATFMGVVVVNLVAMGNNAVVDGLAFVGVMLLGLFVFGFLAGALNIVGMFYCCWAPKKSGARPYIRASLALLAGTGLPFMIGACLLIFGSLVDPGGGVATASLIAFLVCLLLSFAMVLASFVLFFLFIRRFSFYLEEGGIAQEAMELLIIWFWVGVIGPFLFGVMMLAYFVDFYWFMGLGLIMGFAAGYWSYHYVYQWIRMLNMISAIRKVLITYYHI